MAGNNDFWATMGKVAVVNWMLDFPCLKKEQGRSGWSDAAVHNIVNEANRRIRQLKESNAKLERENRRLTGEVLNGMEYIDHLEMAVIELRGGNGNTGGMSEDAPPPPTPPRSKPRWRGRSNGSKPSM